MSDESVNIEIENQCDPIPGSWVTSGCSLRSYQADAMRNIFDAVVQGKGGRFAVTFPRQSGKNEMQAQLEAAVMAANQHRGGNIIKIIPTEKNQGKVSTERLSGVLRAALRGQSLHGTVPDKDHDECWFSWGLSLHGTVPGSSKER